MARFCLRNPFIPSQWDQCISFLSGACLGWIVMLLFVGLVTVSLGLTDFWLLVGYGALTNSGLFFNGASGRAGTFLFPSLSFAILEHFARTVAVRKHIHPGKKVLKVRLFNAEVLWRLFQNAFISSYLIYWWRICSRASSLLVCPADWSISTRVGAMRWNFFQRVDRFYLLVTVNLAPLWGSRHWLLGNISTLELYQIWCHKDESYESCLLFCWLFVSCHHRENS